MTTIAWRLAHLVVGVLGKRNAFCFGGPPVGYRTYDYPLTADAVVAETLAVAAAGVPFDVVPGVSIGTAVPAYAGVPLGSTHAEVDVRGRRHDELDERRSA